MENAEEARKEAEIFNIKLKESFSNTEEANNLMKEIDKKAKQGKFIYRVEIPKQHWNIAEAAILYLQSKGFVAEVEIDDTRYKQGCYCHRKWLNVKW
jgi:hypothetical protein